MPDQPPIRLVPIDREGTAAVPPGALSEIAEQVLDATRQLYERVGFLAPWTGYLAVEASDEEPSCVLATCGFTHPPRDGCVEIAYFTFPDFEGRGIATQMATRLTEIACATDPKCAVTAHTMADNPASHRVLEKLGFEFTGTTDHPEDGEVQVWRLPQPPGD